MTATEPRPLALVTGASSGTGLELARESAEHGFDLVIAAEDERINDAAQELRNGIAVEAVQVDLATDGGVEQLWQRVRSPGRHLEAAARNAGIGVGGAFAGGTALETELKLVDLNARSTVRLAKRVARRWSAGERAGSSSPPRSPRRHPAVSGRLHLQRLQVLRAVICAGAAHDRAGVGREVAEAKGR